MFKSMAGIAQTQQEYGCCGTGITPISQKKHWVLFNLYKNNSFCCTDYSRLVIGSKKTRVKKKHQKLFFCLNFFFRIIVFFHKIIFFIELWIIPMNNVSEIE